MKILALALTLTLATTVNAQTATPKPVTPRPSPQAPWNKIPTPPLHPFHPQQPKRIELANGMVIFLQEDHELPFINGYISIRGGSRDEPANKVGLVSLYGEAWRTSGTTNATGDALDDQLEAKAARVESNGSFDYTSLSFSSLKPDFDSVFGIAVDLLLHPAFKKDKLQLAKRQMETGIARRNDDASGIAGREAVRAVYGPNSPFGRNAEHATVEAVTLKDLEQFHDRTVIPNNIILAIGGDFDSAAMETKLRAIFSNLKRGPATDPTKLDFPGPKPGVYFVDKTDVNQSNVYIVGLGTRRDNPDYYALNVMNEIFSGGFGSRLTQSVRTKLGLAYDVGGGFGSSYDHPGIFRVEAGTKSASTVPAAQAMLDEINRLKTAPPTPEELASAKRNLLNSFIFHYDSRDKTLGEQVTLFFYGYPPDFLERYPAAIQKVTAADVSRVANKYIDTSKLAIVVVGNQSQLTPALTTLGPVTPIDITIPPPPGAPKE